MDSHVALWARESIRPDVRALALARERFMKRATSKRLHELRAATRRLLSALEDWSDVMECAAERAELADLGTILGKARDLHVQRKLLDRVRPTLPGGERRRAKKLRGRMRRRESRRLDRAQKALSRLPPFGFSR